MTLIMLQPFHFSTLAVQKLLGLQLLFCFRNQRKAQSTVPTLPTVNNGNSNSNYIRPGSVESSHKTNQSNHGNSSKSEFTKANSISNYSLDSSISSKKSNKNSNEKPSDQFEEFGLSVTKIESKSEASNLNSQPKTTGKKKFGQIIDFRTMINEATKLNAEEGSNDPSDRLMKPLAGYIGYNSEWRELAQVISRDIYMHNPNVKWDDIIGLESAKRTIKEAVVYPIKYPMLFTGILSPWKGLLLYGPPGTGKTLLAKAVATECETTFFNISASSIVSKWRGDSEKLVRVLFEMARFYAPSTIFMDELESIMSIRGSSGGGAEHEGSRRMKTELLVQMDGLAKSDDLVFLLAASNIPWELDHAMLRRLEKRIIVDLPTYEARIKMFTTHLPATVIKENGLSLTSDLDYSRLAEITDGYSGSDIKLVCKEAAMKSVRKVFSALENLNEGDELNQLILDPIRTEDVEAVLLSTKPSAKQFKNKYDAWRKEYESNP
ncbi:katanin p60 ATPase-containing subunit A-like 2 isoform X7 [Brachionus plicatilis]|uniref:Katanin p60 ATPase-containing subunit A-like 2 n=1 Tax=Brachionus plicatilis TaxID=10195 RepID=A0A3M7QGG1_BRAPC|nr:katanin p60 ATPase-containing subunit A-like 2 isoform X7 [Brachionus plicatilis]